MSVLLNSTAQSIIELAKEHLGHPYVYAGAGQLCTPENRRGKINSDYPSIVDKCQVLNNANANNCNGCKYNGKRFFDCRGFTYWILKQNNITISAVGATTQYNTATSWEQRGKIEDMPNVVCCVFKYKEDTKKMSHTGLHIGDGVIIHCTGVKTGEVQYDAVGSAGWTHFGIPKNLYTAAELSAAEKFTAIAGLKKGMSGFAVTELQEKLNQLGYMCDIDGKYGNDTANAVKQFQQIYNLTADGIAGTITRTLLLYLAQSHLTINNSQINIESTNFDTPIIIKPIVNDEKISITLDRQLAIALYQELTKVL